MLLLLLQYNKVTNESLKQFSRHSSVEIKWGSLTDLLDIDCSSYHVIDRFMQSFLPFDAVMVGDIFWPTGQHICKWCSVNEVRCFFLQHGQWIYTKNKKNPKFLPSCTFLFGKNIQFECSDWEYGKRSVLFATGSPRYDGCSLTSKEGDYIYFSPPVLLEETPSVPPRYDCGVKRLLLHMKGLDSQARLVIHPHYREGAVRELKKIFPHADIIDPHTSALELIQKSQKVLTHRNSTVVLDSIACGKQVVLMNLDVYPSYYPKGYFGSFAIESNSLSNCVRNLEKDYEIEDVGQYMREAEPYVILGDASCRIDSIICANTV